jgi:hypothetical protein
MFPEEQERAPEPENEPVRERRDQGTNPRERQVESSRTPFRVSPFLKSVLNWDIE